MPSPKSGDPGSIVPPAAPEVTLDAINAKPGENASGPGGGGSSSGGSGDASTATPYKKAAGGDDKKKHWIELVLVDEKNDPVAGEAYAVTLPDGKTVASGTLDEKGFVRIDGIDAAGTCQITFPNLDGKSWQAA